MKRWALCVAVVAVAAAAGVTAEPAQACSCAIVDAREALARFDAAFIGTLIERGEETNGRVTLVFRVEERFKGSLGDTVAVRTASNGAACGIEAPIGSRIGLFLEREGGDWHGSLCSQVEPTRLREAARPLPAPNGTGPVALLVGGPFGPMRLLSLDAKGRTLAYGKGDGGTSALSVCPGKQRVAEVAQVDSGVVVAVRELQTLRLVRVQRLTLPAVTHAADLRCEDPEGTRLLIFATSSEFPQRARLLRVTRGGTSTVWRGTALYASLGDRVAYVNAGRRATTLLAVDLHTRLATTLTGLPAFTGPLVPNPAGTRLAGVAHSAPVAPASPPSRVVVVDLARRPAGVRTSPLGGPNVAGDVFWLTAGGLVFLPARGDADDARVYDPALRVTSRFPGWNARAAALAGSTAFGLDYQGRLLRAGLPSGPVRVVRRLPSSTAYLIVSTSR